MRVIKFIQWNTIAIYKKFLRDEVEQCPGVFGFVCDGVVTHFFGCNFICHIYFISNKSKQSGRKSIFKQESYSGITRRMWQEMGRSEMPSVSCLRHMCHVRAPPSIRFDSIWFIRLSVELRVFQTFCTLSQIIPILCLSVLIATSIHAIPRREKVGKGDISMSINVRVMR